MFDQAGLLFICVSFLEGREIFVLVQWYWKFFCDVTQLEVSRVALARVNRPEVTGLLEIIRVNCSALVIVRSDVPFYVAKTLLSIVL